MKNMKVLYNILALLVITGCATPESLVHTQDDDSASAVVETYSEAEQIAFPYYYVQLVEVSRLKKEANNSIKLTLNLLNDGVPQNTQIKDIFSVKSLQGEVNLKNLSTKIEGDKFLKTSTVVVEFLLVSDEEVIFEFTSTYKEQIKKHYSVFLE